MSWNGPFVPDYSLYKNDYSKATIIGVGGMMTLLPIIAVALRFYTRHHFHIGYGLDDWTILFALVLCVATGVTDILGAAIGGLGSHQELGPNGELIHTTTLYNYEKCRYIVNFLSTMNLGIVKIAIVLFYRRLFVVKAFRTTSAIAIGILAAWTTAFGFSMMVQCVPINYFWRLFEIQQNPPHCVRVRYLYLGLAYSDFILDMLVLILPIPFVWVLHMSWRKKIAVIDVLLLGSVVLGSGIGRLVTYIKTNAAINSNPIQYLHDTPWWTAGTLFWAFITNSVGIIGASLPTLSPLWNRRERNQRESMAMHYPHTNPRGKYGDEYGTDMWTNNTNEAFDRPEQRSSRPSLSLNASDRTTLAEDFSTEDHHWTNNHVPSTQYQS